MSWRHRHLINPSSRRYTAFLTETLRALFDEGILYRDEAGDWKTSGHAELPVPESVAQTVERRIGRLAPDAQDLLGIAAVIGRDVEIDLWLAAGPRDEEAALTAAEALMERGLLLPAKEPVWMGRRKGEDGAPATGRLLLRFSHDTICQVVYEGLSPVRRRRWHRQVASALEALIVF